MAAQTKPRKPAPGSTGHLDASDREAERSSREQRRAAKRKKQQERGPDKHVRKPKPAPPPRRSAK